MKLVICEKPSVGAAVAAALGVTGRKDGYIEGNGYLISWYEANVTPAAYLRGFDLVHCAIFGMIVPIFVYR